MAGLKLHRDAAAPGVLQVLEALSSVLPHRGYYLAGGTALALLEGHRISIDIDIFGSELQDPQRLLHDLETEIKGIENAALGAGAVYFEISGVQVSIISYRYPLLKPKLVPSFDLIPLADPDDIAAMKLAAITGRGSRKDFVDLWTLISRHRSLEFYLQAFRNKYLNRDTGHVLRSLTYFDDAENDPSLRLIAPVDWELVKTDFRSWVRKLLP